MFVNFIIALLFVIFIVNDISAAKGLPSYLKLCKRHSPNLGRCFEENIQLLLPYFKTGIPELFIPPMDPLVIPVASLNGGDSFKADFKNIKLYSVDQFTIEKLAVDLDKLHLGIKIAFPLIRIISDYELNGRLIILTLNGHGWADGNYTNVQADVILAGENVKKQNKEYIKWRKEKVDISIEKSHLYFYNLFPENEELNQRTNEAINNNIDGIITELLPVIRGIVSDFIFNVLNRVFGKYSLQELFIA